MGDRRWVDGLGVKRVVGLASVKRVRPPSELFRLSKAGRNFPEAWCSAWVTPTSS